jgi:hypothetical protein
MRVAFRNPRRLPQRRGLHRLSDQVTPQSRGRSFSGRNERRAARFPPWRDRDGVVSMPKGYEYFEWDPEIYGEAARQRAAEAGDIESLYDREMRMRVGDLIARAMRAADSGGPKQWRSARNGIQ